MTKKSTPMDDILEAADALTDATQVATPYHVWTEARNKLLKRHTVVLPGLLQQLYDAVMPAAGTGDAGRTPPASRPPLALEALSTHTVIVLSAADWCWRLRIDQRDTPQQNIRALVGAAPRLDVDEQRKLRADLRRWRTWCAVMLDWERVDAFKDTPCPRCDKPGSLRVNLTQRRGFCINQERDGDGQLVCGGVWAEDEAAPIEVLAEHIRAWRERAELDVDQRRHEDCRK